jgi:LysM repeat protein
VDTYTVQAGDTLTKIAEALYGDGSLWTIIFEANKKTLKNPDKIMVGQELKIPNSSTSPSDEETDEEEDEESDEDEDEDEESDDDEDEDRPTLRVGSKATKAVKMLQKLLVAAGYEIAVDGVFGKGTKEAVLDVQAEAELDEDGVVGPDTWDAIDELASEEDDEDDEDDEDEEEEDDE